VWAARGSWLPDWTGDVEVEKDGAAVPECNVAGLDVQVDQPYGVHVVQAGGELQAKADDVAGVERSLLVQQSGQRRPLDVFEHEVGKGVTVPVLEQPLNAWVREPAK